MSLLCALFDKTGTGLDLQEIDRRKKLIEDRDEAFRRHQERALREGDISRSEVKDYTTMEELNLSEDWFPVLITVPNSVLQNWLNEFKTWGHFGVAVFHSGGERETALTRVTCGKCEILLTTHSFFQGRVTFKQMNEAISWRLVIIDEFHKFRVRIVDGLIDIDCHFPSNQFAPSRSQHLDQRLLLFQKFTEDES